jgi:hypothetical protein
VAVFAAKVPHLSYIIGAPFTGTCEAVRLPSFCTSKPTQLFAAAPDQWPFITKH